MGGLGFGQQESRSKPTIEPSAISPGQREQLYPILGEMLGFSYNPTLRTGAGGGGGAGGPLYPGFKSADTTWGTMIANPPNLTNIGSQWGAGNFAYKDVTKPFDPVSMLNLAPAQSTYRNMLESAMSNPYALTSAENNLLNSIMASTSAQFANRGFGASPIAASTVGASIAPSLIAMRQQQLNNIMAALGIDIGEQQKISEMGLTQRSQDVTQRQQDMDTFAKQRQMQIEGLLKFLESMGLSRNMGQQSASSGFNFSGNYGGGGGGGSPGGGKA